MRKILLLVAIATLTLFSFKNVKISEQTPESKIIGTWFFYNDNTLKLVFDSNKKLFEYRDGQLEKTSAYSISHSCGVNSDSNFYFLKVVDEDGTQRCYEINGINENNSGILSLTFMRDLKVTIFINNTNIRLSE